MLIVQLSDADQELYKNFPLVVSERWQEEIADTVFDYINQETDKVEQKRKQKVIDELEDDCKLHVLSWITKLLSHQYRYALTKTS